MFCLRARGLLFAGSRGAEHAAHQLDTDGASNGAFRVFSPSVSNERFGSCVTGVASITTTFRMCQATGMVQDVQARWYLRLRQNIWWKVKSTNHVGSFWDGGAYSLAGTQFKTMLVACAGNVIVIVLHCYTRGFDSLTWKWKMGPRKITFLYQTRSFPLPC